ncbi:MAG: hypothetical protein KDA52_06255 [Planctomycetaceae bacterium]|nr:hypothetical protein [Planctomycetaceae bacterium]
MNHLTRCPASGLALLIVTAAFASETCAEEPDLWNLLGTNGVNRTSSRGVDDDIWDLMGSGVAGSQSTVEFQDIGIVLSVTPTVTDSKERAQPLFVLFPDETWFNIGTAHTPRWEPISKDEFQLLFEQLEKQDDCLIAELYEEGRLILQFVLM